MSDLFDTPLSTSGVNVSTTSDKKKDDKKSASASEPLASKIQYKFLSEEHEALRFRLSHVDVSVANAIRRTLLSDIPINVIRTERKEGTDSVGTPDCNILVNTGRLTNEILKHRLSLIPIYTKHLTSWSETDQLTWINKLPGRVELEVDVQADETLRYVTTEDFKLRVKSDDELVAAGSKKPQYLPTTVSQQIFPKNAQTQSFIEFARLRPKLGDAIPGEHLHLVAQFSIGTAKENSSFNVVSKCAYQNTQREDVHEIWDKEKDKLSGLTADELASKKKDFMCLDAQRHFVPDSFDFVVQTVGIYRNEELLHKACDVLTEKVLAFYDAVRDNQVLIRRSEAVSMENCYDVTLEQEDYTLGNLLTYLLLETYFFDGGREAKLSFCGFKKEHPHDDDSTLRMAFRESADETVVRECLKNVCGKAHAIFERVGRFFGNH